MHFEQARAELHSNRWHVRTVRSQVRTPHAQKKAGEPINSQKREIVGEKVEVTNLIITQMVPLANVEGSDIF